MNKILSGKFSNILKLIRQNLSRSTTIAVLDVAFFVSFAALHLIFNYIAKSFSIEGELFFAIYLTLTILYYCIIILVYSFFKYCILYYISGFFGNKILSFGRFWKFFVLNSLLTSIFFSIMLVFNFILANTKLNFQPYLFMSMAVPYLIYLYFSINISQTLFFEGSSIGKSLKSGLNSIFINFRKYNSIMLLVFVSVASAWVFLAVAGYIIRTIYSGNFALYLAYYGYFKQASIMLVYMIGYLLIYFNRMSFYSILKRK